MPLPFKVSKSFLIIAVFFIAIVTPSTLFPFIVGKYVWFRAAVDVALLVFALGFLFHPHQSAVISIHQRLVSLYKNPLVIAVSAFVVIFLLAGFFGVDPAMSFWSNFERGEGGIQILHLYVFFMLLAVLFREEHDWQKLFACSLVAGLFMTFYGLGAGLRYTDAELATRHLPQGGVEETFTGKGGPWYQTFKSYIGPSFKSDGYRFQGSIGNAAYVAAYAIFMLFYAAYLLATKYRARLHSFGAFVLFFLLAVFLAVFWFAATRGAFLGLVGAVLAFLGYFIYAHKKWRRWLLAGSAVVVIMVGLLVSFKDAPFVKAIPGSRIFDLSFTAETFQHRTIMWGIALEGWKERPLLGWGPENYIQVFDRRFDPAYFEPTKGFGAWFDRAHSIYFDYLVETGALGIVSFLAIFVVLYRYLFRSLKRENGDAPTQEGHRGKETPPAFRALPSALAFALPVAYLIQGIVLFDVLPIYVNVFLFLAFMVYRMVERPLAPKA
ncbi:MAG: O-antigen ligase family protein [Candidatus Brennerbacteria bacterium]|nr:O-antigen ligase family protein [Candidatus Brennerbacteria bacterium]